MAIKKTYDCRKNKHKIRIIKHDTYPGEFICDTCNGKRLGFANVREVLLDLDEKEY